MTDFPLSGCGHGHMSNFYILDLENVATASCRCGQQQSSMTSLWITPTMVERVVAGCTSLLYVGGLAAGYQPRPQVVDRGTTARYGGQLRYV